MKSIMFPVDDSLAEKLGRCAKRAGWKKSTFNRLALALFSDQFLAVPNEELGNWLSRMLELDIPLDAQSVDDAPLSTRYRYNPNSEAL